MKQKYFPQGHKAVKSKGGAQQQLSWRGTEKLLERNMIKKIII